jgi:ketosteroid isomerase-like protein
MSMANAETEQAAIRAARAHSNRSIVRRNLLGVGDSLAEDYVGIIGDGAFVASRAEYLRLFKLGFDAPKKSLTYERIADRVEVAADGLLAAEHGHWTARDFSGAEAYTGSYSAMWRREPQGWKIRSEMFVTLTSA